MERRQDIDQLRGLAILLMVMVHAAATWAPNNASTTSFLALVVAGLGGLAAPLFVTVGGWVTVQSSWSIRKAMIRFVYLMLAQLLLNICAPHLFDPFTSIPITGTNDKEIKQTKNNIIEIINKLSLLIDEKKIIKKIPIPI